MLRPVVAVALLLVSVHVAHATVVEKLALPALVAQSHRVVMGRVVSRESGWDPSGMRIFTRCRVDVRETLRGAASSEITVFSWGGSLGDLGQMVVGEVAPVPGDLAVFFLAPSPLPGTFHVVGLAQGMWPVTQAPDGTPLVSRQASRLTLSVPGQAGSSSVLVADPGVPATSYEAFRNDVVRLSAVTP